ncbi:cation:proton antiporter [Patescibacteria group bacterium]
MDAIFFEISMILIVGTVCAAVAKFLRQPMIPAYILAGVLLGPSVFKVIERGELLETLATFGIAFLLFLVGIELDLRKLIKTGKVSIFIGVIQMAFAIGIGYLIIRALGFESGSAFFLAVALGFSSTIVVMKLLGERKELDSLYGQIVIGIMLTQDFIAILFLLFFGVFTGDASGVALISEIGMTVIKGAALISVALLASRYILSHVFRYFAKTSELLFLGSIMWALVFSIMAILLGFSVEVGALLAGISLSFLPYSIEIANRVSSIRDFFLPIFFAVLGGQLVFSGAGHVVIPTVVLSSLVLFVSPIVVIGILLWFGYQARTSFHAGTSIGQVSEFSFILVSLGFAAGIVSEDIVALVALIGLVTMTLSSYFIEYMDPIFAIFKPFLKSFERKGKAAKLERVPKHLTHHVILFGYHSMGYRAHQIVEKMGKPFVVVDNNPDVVAKLEETDILHLYGSISDDEVLEKVHISRADFIICTVPNAKAVLGLLAYVKKNKIKAKLIVTAFHVDDALDFYKGGAAFVLYPTLLSADYLTNILKGDIRKQRSQHLKEIKDLQSVQLTT